MQIAKRKIDGQSYRKTGTGERALATAAEILRREGYSRLTMERVAGKSGVAKTTIYRRWPTKAALCMELYLAVAGRELHDPDTGEPPGYKGPTWWTEWEPGAPEYEAGE